MTDKELILKKTARRRLVGAVTLVILMLIILPFVLKDRVAELAQEDVEVTVINEEAPPQSETPTGDLSSPIIEEGTQSIQDASSVTQTSEALASTTQATNQQPTNQPPKITTSDVGPANKAATNPSTNTPQAPATATKTAIALPTAQQATEPSKTVPKDNALAANNTNVKENAAEKTSVELTQTKPNTEKKPEKTIETAKNDSPVTEEKQRNDVKKEVPTTSQKTLTAKTPAIKAVETKTKKTGQFFVQFGVFTDPNNLDSLRQKLAQSGIESVVEPIAGNQQKFKLRSQMYSQREDAQTAQQQMQALGVSGIVVAK